MQVEIDGDVFPGQARVIEDANEIARARSLVFEKYAPRTDDELREWRNSALPIAIEPTST